MPATVGVNKRTVVHAQSNGVASFMPDVCLTPAPPGPPVPIPYPNVAQSQSAAKGATSVLVEGNPVLVEGSTFATSSGDEAGVSGGVASGSIKGEAEFVAGSFDVFAENKGVARALDLMLGNKKNTPPMPVQQPPLLAMGQGPGELQPDSMEVLVTDAKGDPLAGVKYLLLTPDGQKIEGKTDASGKITVQETVQGLGRIVFPELEPGTVVEPGP